MTAYAWIIDKDHLTTRDEGGYAEGVSGPGRTFPEDAEATEELLERLKAGEGLTFRLYDDDGELYYTGRGLAAKDDLGTEEFCYGPLGDFGMGWAGCTEVRWVNHPEWDCG